MGACVGAGALQALNKTKLTSRATNKCFIINSVVIVDYECQNLIRQTRRILNPPQSSFQR